MTSLAYDICRCKGSGCDIKETCLRHMALSDEDIPEYARIAVSDNLCYVVGVNTKDFYRESK